MKIYVVGAGKLARAILSSDLSFPGCQIIEWEKAPQTSKEKAIVIHAGSGRQLKECLEFCKQTKSTFIELSTGQDTANTEAGFPIIICHNTSILLLKTLAVFKSFGGHFDGYKISITESHQATKTTDPGTAYALANSLKFPVNKIVSIRDPEVQLNELGIPKEFLDRHAYHKIVIEDGTDQLTIETKVLGHNSYVQGVKRIIEAVIKHPLENRLYTVVELIEKNMV